MKKTYLAIIVIVIIAIASVSGYVVYNTFYGSSPTKPTLTVFVAASMQHVVENMTAQFEQEHNCKITINAAGSSTLEAQIVAGSTCDVFMSADKKWTVALNDSNLVYNGYINNSFTQNKLVIIVAPGNPKNIASLADLVGSGVRIAIGDPTIPVGSYTNKTLTKITNTWGNASSPSYITNGSYVNYYTNFQNNVVDKLLTVEEVVGKVSLNQGVVDAGIVYYSDEAYANIVGNSVEFIPIPDSVNTVGTYGICIVDGTTQATLAQEFYNYWLSSEGQTLLKEYGFGV